MIKMLAKIISWISLVLLLVPSLLFLTGRMELDKVKFVMLIITIVWFVAAAIGLSGEKS